MDKPALSRDQLEKNKSNIMKVATYVNNHPEIKKRINEVFFEKVKNIKNKKDFDLDKLVLESSQEALKEFPEILNLVKK